MTRVAGRTPIVVDEQRRLIELDGGIQDADVAGVGGPTFS